MSKWLWLVLVSFGTGTQLSKVVSFVPVPKLTKTIDEIEKEIIKYLLFFRKNNKI